jgi:glycosyltransferase involved in cell wall biosynthesis
MNYSLVIAAHNEEDFIIDCLNSVFSQTVLPKEIVVVNDNSTDRTEALLREFQSKRSELKVLNHSSSSDHMPGSKVVAAFNYGLQEIKLNSIDLIVKLDADLILPSNYFEEVIDCFQTDIQIGIVGGFAYEQDKSGTWKLNHPMNKNHVRGAFKTYRVDCFQKMNGLRVAMGWDTADELLAQYHGYKIKTLDHLKVKHLRPLGKAYNKKAKLLQGKAMFGLRYGFTLSLIASFKSAYKQARLKLFIDQIQGYLKAKKEKAPYLVTETEGAYIRKLRWSGIFKKLIP